MQSLSRLPPEIILDIASYVTPSIPATDKSGKNTWAIWHEDFESLLHLALTSRSLNEIVTPVLHRTIAIRSGTSIAKLLAALVQNPWMRNSIENISCLTDITRNETARAVNMAWEEDIPSTHSVLMSVGCDAHEIDRREGRLAVRAFNAILCFAPRLRTLVLEFSEGYPNLNLLLPALYSQSAQARQPGYEVDLELQRSRNSARTGLREIRIRYSLRIANSYVTNLFLVLPQLPSLKTLEISRFHGRWMPSNQPSICLLPQVEHIRLYESFVGDNQVAQLLRACVNLRSLLVHFRAHHPFTNSTYSDTSSDPTINEILPSVAHTLESLELLSDGATTQYLLTTAGRTAPNKLTCLPHLTNLRHLTVDLRGLYGSAHESDELGHTGTEHKPLLPASLCSLVLVGYLGHLPSPSWTTGPSDTLGVPPPPVLTDGITRVLHDLRLGCARSWPLLRSVTLCLSTRVMKTHACRTLLDPHRVAFAQEGVHFWVSDVP